VKGYVTLALAQLAQGHADQAAATYQRLAGVSARGASFAAMGQADLAMYQGRMGDAIAALEPAAAADLAAGNPGGAAKKRAAIAEAQLALGHTAAALAAAAQALAGGKSESVYVPAALVYIGARQDARAAALSRELGQRLEPLPQAYSKLIDGAIALAHDRARDAIARFQESQKIEDSWIGRLYLARAYLAAGALTEADSELDRCIERRGEAVDIFSDDVETFHYLPPVYYFLGRLRQELKSPDAADAFRAFLKLKDSRDTEPLGVDARKRIQ
jgi:tetratricopeptide (TPR) repeat protein